MLHNSYVHCVTFDVALPIYMLHWDYCYEFTFYLASEYTYLCKYIPKDTLLNIKIDMISTMHQFNIFKLFMLHIRVFFKYTV